MGGCKKKDNDFEKLIDDCGTKVEYDDLLKMLDAKLDMFTKLYLRNLSVIGSLILIKNIFEPIITQDIHLKILKWISSLVAMCLIGYIVLTFIQIQPFKTQRKIFKDFIEARSRLKELKK